MPRASRLRPRPSVRRSALGLASALTAACLAAQMSMAQPLTWERWPMPEARYDHVAVFDAPRDRMIVFGGTTPGLIPDSRETWALKLSTPPRWEWLGDPESVTPRSLSAAVLDPIGDQMVLFGGRSDGINLGSTWRFNCSSHGWNSTSFGSPPPAGYGYTGVFDAIRRRMLVLTPQDPPSADVHALDLATMSWSTLATSGTPPPIGGGRYPAAHDEPRDRLVVLGPGGVWELTLAGTPTWTQLAPSGTPPPDHVGDMFFDAVRDRMVVVRHDGEVWALSLKGSPDWSSIAIPPLPTGPHLTQIAHDAARDRLLWFGSSSLNDVWVFALGSSTWSLLHPGSPIPQREWHSAVAVPPWDAMVIFGGGFNTTWRFPITGAASFEQVATAGPTPTPRTGHAAIYDPVRARMIVFGGNDGIPLNDVHALSIGPTPTWSPIAPSGGPPPAGNSHAIYDPVRDRMVVFGGDSNDVWALSLGDSPEWSQLASGEALPMAHASQAVYDSRRDRLLAIARDLAEGPVLRSWYMPLGGPHTWTSHPGTIPEVHEYATAYDSTGDRVLLQGGLQLEGTSVTGAFRQMDAATGLWASAQVSGTPVPLFRHRMVRDPLRERFILHGGRQGLIEGSDPFFQSFQAPAVWIVTAPYSVGSTASPTRMTGGLTFARLWLAAADRIAFEVTVTGVGAADVDVFDVSGRRLGRASLEPSGSGPRAGTVQLDRPVPPGVYLVRVRQGTLSATRRLVALR